MVCLIHASLKEVMAAASAAHGPHKHIQMQTQPKTRFVDTKATKQSVLLRSPSLLQQHENVTPAALPCCGDCTAAQIAQLVRMPAQLGPATASVYCNSPLKPPACQDLQTCPQPPPRHVNTQTEATTPTVHTRHPRIPDMPQRRTA
jgi:hypothetical protein